MGITQQIGASSLIKPGVCTSSTRPASPFEGQMIYETDTDLVLVWSGSAWVEIASMLTKAPRGIMAFTESTSSDATITSEEVQITGASFTAVANRYYKVTYFEPDVYSVSGATTYVGAKIRLTNISGTVKQASYTQIPTSGVTNAIMNIVWVGTLSAGTTNFVGSLFSNAGTAGADRNSTTRAFLLVEDIGAA